MSKKVNALFSADFPIPSGSPLVTHPTGSCVGYFLRRQKRFSVAVELKGQETWVHSNNSGAMLGLLRTGLPTLVSPAANPKRKLAYTQEAVWLPRQFEQCQHPAYDFTDGFWVGVNTSVPNKLLEAAFHAGLLDFAAGYTEMKREAKRGSSRLDACLRGEGKAPLWVECKNVTMVEDEVALFPDAASERGQKHLQELMDIVRSGERAAMFYLVQRADGRCFAPADVIDPTYATLFWQAVDAGVEVYAMRGVVRLEGIFLGERLPLLRPHD